MSIQETVLPPVTAAVSVRAANEGVPVAAIARIVQTPFDEIAEYLRAQVSCGRIGEMPKADWPPGGRWDARLPSVERSVHSEDIEFQCKRLFKFTKLEAAFVVVLLRHDVVEKEKLHGVIEDQRAKRALRPDRETTDPKMVDVVICKLRKKLIAVDPSYILTTSWGSGYYFDAPVKTAILQRLSKIYTNPA